MQPCVDWSEIPKTINVQVTVAKVAFSGAIRGGSQLCITVKQCFNCGVVANSLLATLVMSYVPLHHRKALINPYLYHLLEPFVNERPVCDITNFGLFDEFIDAMILIFENLALGSWDFDLEKS